MDIVLSRRGGVSVRHQLVTHLELKILSGSLAPGQRLPSVRALARRLDVHPNTVSAAYQDLKAAGRVLLRRGSGVFVRAAGAAPSLPEADTLDGMIRGAFHAAQRGGYSGPQIRSAVERWLKTAPPERLVVVNSSREMAELVAHEVRETRLSEAVGHASIEDVIFDPSILSGALTLCLSYHVETIAKLAPFASFHVLNVEVEPADRQAILALPAGSLLLVVTHSATVVRYASVLLRSLRGEDMVVEARLASATREWRRLLPVADLVFADLLSAEMVRRLRPRRFREMRILNERAVARLAEALTLVVPSAPPEPSEG